MEEHLFISSFEQVNKKEKKRNETKNVRFVNHSMNTKMET